MDSLVSKDHQNWIDNQSIIKQKVKNSLPNNINVSFVFNNIPDNTDDGVVISDTKYTNGNEDIIYTDFFEGIYYNDVDLIEYNPRYTKLYSAFNQRAQYDRLLLFLALYNNNLLDKGYVSFLGEDRNKPMPQTNSQRQENTKEIINNFEDITIDLDLSIIPYKNFSDVDYLETIEHECKYSIVYETYTSQFPESELCFTEKTFRSLTVPNISIFINRPGASQYLRDMGYIVHPINDEIEKIIYFDEKAQYIAQLLKEDAIDIDYDVEYNNALHNKQLLKKRHEIIMSDEYINNIIKKVLDEV
jgi:hypothetical protein